MGAGSAQNNTRTTVVKTGKVNDNLDHSSNINLTLNIYVCSKYSVIKVSKGIEYQLSIGFVVTARHEGKSQGRVRFGIKPSIYISFHTYSLRPQSTESGPRLYKKERENFGIISSASSFSKN